MTKFSHEPHAVVPFGLGPLAAAMVVVLATIAPAGCARGTDLLRTGSVSVRGIDAPPVLVRDLDVRKMKAETVVSGRLVRQTQEASWRGHVHVVATSPDRATLWTAAVPVRAERNSRGGIRSIRFEASTSTELPPGTEVRVRFVPGSHDVERPAED